MCFSSLKLKNSCAIKFKNYPLKKKTADLVDFLILNSIIYFNQIVTLFYEISKKRKILKLIYNYFSFFSTLKF
jgi:hypothetical protein